MDVWEVVTIGRYPYTGFRGVLSAEDKRICEEALATCRLTELRERIFDTLSDGEKQRVMIARALAQETPPHPPRRAHGAPRPPLPSGGDDDAPHARPQARQEHPHLHARA